jgi:peptidyl-prolyl cis-trans isomerase SurA
MTDKSVFLLPEMRFFVYIHLIFYENRPWDLSLILSMKNVPYSADCRFILFFFTVIFLITAPPSFGITEGKVLATVEDEVITMSDYENLIKGIGGDENTGVVDKALLERLIVDKIILQTAVHRGIEVADIEVEKEIEAFRKQHNLSQGEFEAVLSKEGMTLDEYKKGITNKIRAMKLFSVEVESKVSVTEKEIEDYYSGHKEDYLLSPEKVEIKTVLLKLKEDASINEITELKSEALRIATELQKGGSFERLINQQRTVRGSAGIESSTGEFKRGSLAPVLEKKAFSMNKGETSSPIWVKNGVYILKVINRTDESFKPIKDVHKEIYSQIYEQKTKNNFNEWVRTLWEKTSVKIY